jgi:hypothetical protein
LKSSIIALFKSGATIPYNDIFSLLGVKGEDVSYDILDEIGDVVEELVSSGTLVFASWNELRLNRR